MDRFIKYSCDGNCIILLELPIIREACHQNFPFGVCAQNRWEAVEHIDKRARCMRAKPQGSG